MRANPPQGARNPRLPRTCVVDRRAILRGIFGIPPLIFSSYAVAASAAPAPAKPNDPLRLVSLEFAITQVILAVGIDPIAVTDPGGYRFLGDSPPLPHSVLGTGRPEANLELLRLLKPDLILANRATAASGTPVLSKIAPVWGNWNFYLSPDDPYGDAEGRFLEVTRLIGREEQGRIYCAELRKLIGAAANSLNRRVRRPLLVMSVVDRRHASVYTGDSIFGGVLRLLGIQNALPAKSGLFGVSYLGLEQIADLGDADYIIIDKHDVAKNWLLDSPLWKILRPVREGRVALLPPVLTTGSLPTAKRFVELLVPALDSMEPSHG